MLAVVAGAIIAIPAVWWLGFGPIVLRQGRCSIEIVDAEGVRVLPTGVEASDAIRAPIAWLRSRGDGVRVVSVNGSPDDDRWIVSNTAPGASLISLTADLSNPADLAESVRGSGARVAVISTPESYRRSAWPTLRREISRIISSGAAVFVNGDTASSAWEIRLLASLERSGAVVVGACNYQGQVIDKLARRRRVNVYCLGTRGTPSMAPVTAASVAALILQLNNGLTPRQIKARLVESSLLRWQTADPVGGPYIRFTRSNRDGHWLPRRMLFRSPFVYRQLDAARAVGVDLDRPWFIDALNIDEAHSHATGLGARIAIIDQGFELRNSALKGHIVDEAAFGDASFNTHKHPHGAEMSEIALAVAPDAQIIPILCGVSGDEAKDASLGAQAIGYAIEHKADVISMSFGPFPNTPEGRRAIDRAIEAGVSVVWFNYGGHNRVVIRPEPVSDGSGDFGVFSRTFERPSPVELLSGRSPGSPQAAGAVALIRQLHPHWQPAQIKDALVRGAFTLEGGRKVLDAVGALGGY